MAKYDLLIKNGFVIDAANKWQGRADVAFLGGQVAAMDPGADGDLVVADPDTHEAILTVAGVKIVMANSVVVGSGGTVITTERGIQGLREQGVRAEVADMENSLFYNAPEKPVCLNWRFNGLRISIFGQDQPDFA